MFLRTKSCPTSNYIYWWTSWVTQLPTDRHPCLQAILNMVCSWINNPSSDKSWRCSLLLLCSESSECIKKLAESISNMLQQNNLAKVYRLNLERSLWWSWNFSSSDHKPCNPVYEFWSASENARRGQNAFLGFSASVTASITPPGSTHLIATLPHIILLTFLSLYFVILYILNMNFKIFFHQNNFGFLQNSLRASRCKIPILTCYLLPFSSEHALSLFSSIFNHFHDFLDFLKHE